MSDIIEGLALVAFVVAGWLVAPALGLTVAGAALLLVGAAIDGTRRAGGPDDGGRPSAGARPPRVRVPRPRVPRLGRRRPGEST